MHDDILGCKHNNANIKRERNNDTERYDEMKKDKMLFLFHHTHITTTIIYSLTELMVSKKIFCMTYRLN